MNRTGATAMKTLLILGALALPMWGNALFTSKQTGNWADPNTWNCGTRTGEGSNTCDANGGVPACYKNIPCAGDGVDAGDEVLLGNLSHVVTIPAGTTASAGTYRANSGTEVPAIGAVSYANTTARLVVNGKLTVAGHVYMNLSNWEINADPALGGAWSWSSAGDTSPQIVHDSSRAASPSTTHYGWIPNVQYSTSTSAPSKLTVTGTASNSVTFGVAASSGLPAGIGLGSGCPNAASCLHPNGGYMVATYAHFVGWGWRAHIRPDGTTAHACTNCTWDSTSNTAVSSSLGTNSESVLLLHTGVDTGTFSLSRVLFDSTTTSTVWGAVLEVTGATGSASAVSLSDVVFSYGGLYVYSTDTAANRWTAANVLYKRARLTGVPGGVHSGALAYLDGTHDAYTVRQNGTVSNTSVVRYMNSGDGNEHPYYISQGYNSTYHGLAYDSNTDPTGDWIEVVGAAPASAKTVSITDSVQNCGTATNSPADGRSSGSFFNLDPNAAVSNMAITLDHNTFCSSMSAIDETNVMGVGWEGAFNTTFPAGTIASLSNNVAYRDDAAGIVVTANTPVNSGTGTKVQAGFITSAANNSRWNATNAQEVGDNLTSNGITQIASGPSSGTYYSTPAPLMDRWRKLANFNAKYLGSETSCTTWSNGVSATAGEIWCDSQSNQWAGTTTYWRARTNHTTATASNRPLSGSAWYVTWEPVALASIQTAVLNGSTYTDGALGASGVKITELFNRWQRAGYRLVGVPEVCSASDGKARGANFTADDCKATRAFIGTLGVF